MSRLLVTGGTGYVGAVVAELAGAAGWDVTSVGSAGLDVRDAAAVDALFGTVRPDAVVHTAYVRDGPDAMDVNAGGSGRVARAAHAVGARLVHVSSDVVFDGLAGRPYVESDTPSPVNAYGRTKAAAEELVLAAAPTSVVVRTSLVYGGPHRRPSPHEIAARDPAATFYVDELRCPVQVDDLAAALVELAALDVTGPLHVAGADGVSRQQFAALVAGRAVSGAPAPPGRPMDCRLDTSLARSVLHTELRGVRQVLARF